MNLRLYSILNVTLTHHIYAKHKLQIKQCDKYDNTHITNSPQNKYLEHYYYIYS